MFISFTAVFTIYDRNNVHISVCMFLKSLKFNFFEYEILESVFVYILVQLWRESGIPGGTAGPQWAQ